MIQAHIGASADPSEWQIAGMAPVGLAGEVILTLMVCAVAFGLTWFFVKWADRDLRTGRGPLFLYGGKDGRK
jgi:hypothetical protein